MKSSFFKFSIRDIVEIAVMCAFAVVLDKFVKIPIGATGGSINIASVPLFIVAYRHGWFKGLIASGVVFALITCILDAYGFQFFFFEYFIAFGSIAIGGLFGPMIFKTYNRKGVLAKILAIELVILTVCIFFIIRTLAATADSMIFYKYDLAASLIYNLSYIGPSCGIVAILLPFLLPVFKSINETYPTVFLKGIDEDTEEVANEE